MKTGSRERGRENINRNDVKTYFDEPDVILRFGGLPVKTVTSDRLIAPQLNVCIITALY